MRRNHSEAGGRTESSTELIARITAERQGRTARTAGRHTVEPDGAAAIDRSTDPAPRRRAERASRHSVDEAPSRHAAAAPAPVSAPIPAPVSEPAPASGRRSRRRAEAASRHAVAPEPASALEPAAESTFRHQVAASPATTAIPHVPAPAAVGTTALPRVAPQVPAPRAFAPPAAPWPAEDATAVRAFPPLDDATTVRPLPAQPAGTRADTTVIDRVTEEVSPAPIAADDDPADGERSEIEQDRDEDAPAAEQPADLTAARARRRSTSIGRRLAPLAVGAAAMLIAATAMTLVPPADEDQVAAPELSGQFVNAPAVTDPVDDVPQVDPGPLVPPVPEAPAEPPAPAPVAEPAPAPAAPPAPAKPARNEGTQAAEKFGWDLVERDEFDGGLGDGWANPYNGEGHNGNGRRQPEKVTVENGNMVIRGDSDGDTGGIAWDEGQTHGRWEIRAKFPKGDKQYHPVLILWPSAENWPVGGEVDFAETNSDADDVMFFLHYGKDNNQVFDRKQIDITDWHNYAVEWVDGRITGYIDGEKWFESTDDKTLPPGDMHLTIQLDYFPDGGDPEPTEMLVDFVRIYE